VHAALHRYAAARQTCPIFDPLHARDHMSTTGNQPALPPLGLPHARPGTMPAGDQSLACLAHTPASCHAGVTDQQATQGMKDVPERRPWSPEMREVVIERDDEAEAPRRRQVTAEAATAMAFGLQIQSWSCRYTLNHALTCAQEPQGVGSFTRPAHTPNRGQATQKHTPVVHT
jgi:hypothetical protein